MVQWFTDHSYGLTDSDNCTTVRRFVACSDHYHNNPIHHSVDNVVTGIYIHTNGTGKSYHFSVDYALYTSRSLAPDPCMLLVILIL